MQILSLPTPNRADQTTPETTITGVIFNVSTDKEAIPFGDYFPLLPDAAAPDVVKDIDETDNLVVVSDDKETSDQLPAEAIEKDTSAAPHNTLPNRLFTAESSVTATVPTKGDQPEFREIVSPPQTVKKHGFSPLQSEVKDQTNQHVDLMALRSPVELALLSQQLPMQHSIAVPNSVPQKQRTPSATFQSANVHNSYTKFVHAEQAQSLPMSKNVGKSPISAPILFLNELQEHNPHNTKSSEVLGKLFAFEPNNPRKFSLRAERSYSFSETEPIGQRPISELVKSPQYSITVPSTSILKDSKTTVLKPVLDGPKDVSEMRLDTLLETRAPTHTTQQYAANRPEFTSPVTRQIVDVIQARITAEKVIEVSLNPAELGRLKLSLTPAENGLIINVTAERAETIEMVRRNLADLEKAFSEMGHENITFSFDQHDGFKDQATRQHTEAHSDDVDRSDQVTLIPKLSIQHPHDLTTPVGIDIRV
jgi:flagellar hook-length control protein FliK